MGLVLTIKKKESVMIGPEITILLKRVECGQVRVSIDAPQGFVITRSDVNGELYMKRGISRLDDRPKMEHECQSCTQLATHQCGFVSNEVCSTWLCDSHRHEHPKEEKKS